MSEPDRDPALVELEQGFIDRVPFNALLGLRLLAAGDGTARLLLPRRDDLLADPDRGELFGGVITALCDATCGAAVLTRVPRGQAIATLDLRVESLAPAVVAEAAVCEARCDLVTPLVAHVTATVRDAASEATFARALAVFAVAPPLTDSG